MLTVYLLFVYGAGSAYHEQPSRYPTAQTCEAVRSGLIATGSWQKTVCVKAEVLK